MLGFIVLLHDPDTKLQLMDRHMILEEMLLVINLPVCDGRSPGPEAAEIPPPCFTTDDVLILISCPFCSLHSAEYYSWTFQVLFHQSTKHFSTSAGNHQVSSLSNVVWFFFCFVCLFVFFFCFFFLNWTGLIYFWVKDDTH